MVVYADYLVPRRIESKNNPFPWLLISVELGEWRTLKIVIFHSGPLTSSPSPSPRRHPLPVLFARQRRQFYYDLIIPEWALKRDTEQHQLLILAVSESTYDAQPIPTVNLDETNNRILRTEISCVGLSEVSFFPSSSSDRWYAVYYVIYLKRIHAKSAQIPLRACSDPIDITSKCRRVRGYQVRLTSWATILLAAKTEAFACACICPRFPFPFSSHAKGHVIKGHETKTLRCFIPHKISGVLFFTKFRFLIAIDFRGKTWWKSWEFPLLRM